MNKFTVFFRRFVVIAVVGGVAIGACLAAIIPGAQLIGLAHHYTGEVQTLRELSQRTTVYDGAGTQIGTLGTENRQPVTYEEIPRSVIDAVVAIEDQSFWDNNGVDIGGVFRAFVENATAGEIEQGGSTITQQLVKKRVLTSERSLDRKVREIVLAYRLNEQYTKEEILTQYLNTVYYGQGSYGLQSAAERFFYKNDLSTLTLGQAALLAGLIQNPEGDNPFIEPERAIERRAEVLEAEVEEGYITQEEADLANLEPLPTVKPPTDLRPSNDFVEEVQAELLQDPRLGETEKERRDALLSGGLNIYTTWDQNMQAQAEEAVASTVTTKPGFTASLVAMDPRTGHVKAMVKGSGFADTGFNIVTDGIGRQMGSTWKVITLSTVIANGYSANDIVDGSAPCRVRGFAGQTTNAEGGGTGTIRRQTTGSVNCAFVRMATSVGYDKVIDMAVKMGLRPVESPEDPRPLTSEWGSILTLTLGVVEATPLEMVTVDATIASGGVRRDPVFVSRVEAPDGSVLIDDTAPPGTRVMDEPVANCVIDILHGPLGNGGTAEGLAPFGQDAFGKTGTTDERTNAAFLGSTPQLSAFVWHGAPEGNIPGAGFGGEIPATIWNRFMNSALAGVPGAAFPNNVSPGCNAPGQRVNPDGGRIAEALPPPRAVEPAPAPAPTPTPTAPPVIVVPPVTQPANRTPQTLPPPAQAP